MVSLDLSPGETVIAEVGALNHMGPEIKFDTRLGDGSSSTKGIFGKLVGIGNRVLSGEGVFVSHFSNNSSDVANVSLSSAVPGMIIPIDLSNNNNAIICQKDAFLAAESGVHITVAFTKKITAGFFSGAGFVLQKIKGDGIVFLNAGGSIIRREIVDSELLVETGSLVAFTKDLDFDVKLMRPGNALFSKEGLFLTRLRGTGSVWVQSHTLTKLASRIHELTPDNDQ